MPEGAQAGDLVGLEECEYQPADGKTEYGAECSTLVVAEGDPSGLARINLATAIAPKDQQIFGDQAGKAGTLDWEKYGGIESVSLGDSNMGASMAEWVWPLVQEWPIQMSPENLREFQESDVEMLMINGIVDFSTPLTALDKARPYFHKAQMVLLPVLLILGLVLGVRFIRKRRTVEN